MKTQRVCLILPKLYPTKVKMRNPVSDPELNILFNMPLFLFFIKKSIFMAVNIASFVSFSPNLLFC